MFTSSRVSPLAIYPIVKVVVVVFVLPINKEETRVVEKVKDYDK